MRRTFRPFPTEESASLRRRLPFSKHGLVLELLLVWFGLNGFLFKDFFPRAEVGIFWTGHPNNPTARAWDRDRLLRCVDGSPPSPGTSSMIKLGRARTNATTTRKSTEAAALPLE